MMHYFAIPGLKRRPKLRRERTYLHVKNAEDIINMVAERKGLCPKEMITKTRKREIVYARQLCAYLLTKFTILSLSVIGKRLGGRDHTTVIHCRQLIMDLIDSDPLVTHEVEELEMLVVKTIN